MIRAVLFDVDGTLYLQSRLRMLMASELATVPWLQHAPWRVGRVWALLRTFRRVREELRALGRPDAPLERLQYTEAAARAGVPEAEMESVVDEWIVQRPLKYLRHVVRPGAADVLSGLRRSGLEVGVFSDYPAREKLRAMRLDHLVTLAVEATDAEVNAFKPHPRGFLVAAERWGLDPGDILYVGDRPEVDAAGAVAAGMACAVIGQTGGDSGRWSYVQVAEMDDLQRAIVERRWEHR